MIWGVISWIPATYTLTSMYLCAHPTDISLPYSAVLIVLGLLFLYINYEADLQKQVTRRTNGQSMIWGRKPSILKAKYQTSDGNLRESILLVDGYWKFSRHFHYVPEILLTLCWTLPAGFSNFVPWYYFFQLTGLLIDRTIRDETRCKLKYGKTWDEYCKLNKYRIIPFVF